ncbi:glucose-1-phosphate thymidylyltransferase [Bacillus sp. CAG:988]|nr:glucose-1-phosphate thymidylyltransferase [Bacillus sp. CAG:988]
MKGIILAGGSGTRLYPITEGISKQLMPIYDKPMIFYPLSTLMMAKIQDILVITTPQDQDGFVRLLGDGSKFGVHLSYVTQPSPDGLAQAFLLGEQFIQNEPCAMVLGDNIYFGNDFKKLLESAKYDAYQGYATNFGYAVKDPERFGIMELDQNQNIISVEEKPKHPKSKYAITGLYFYPDNIVSMAKLVKPSPRGELEITTLNDMYLKENCLKAQILGEGFTWFDTGTPDSQLEAANMIKSIQSNKGTVICSPEVIGYQNGWLSREELLNRGELLHKNEYGKYLIKVAKE